MESFHRIVKVIMTGTFMDTWSVRDCDSNRIDTQAGSFTLRFRFWDLDSWLLGTVTDGDFRHSSLVD